MILTEKLTIKICSKNLKHFRNYGYDVSCNQLIEINVNELPLNSKKLVKVKCENCNIEKDIQYCDYMKITKSGQYFCSKCKWIKTKATIREKYGVENVFQSSEIKDKIKKTNQEKYGADFPNQNPVIFNKVKETNLKNLKVQYPTQNPNVLKKQHETNEKKYKNAYSFLNKEVKNKITLTIQKKYGVDNPMQSEIIKKKAIDTKIENLLKKFQIINIISIKNNIYKFKCDCGKEHEFEILPVLLYHRLKYKTKLCTICNEINSYNNSGFQIELGEFIEKNCDFDVIKNDRTLIAPNELDFYITQLKLAFEFNGLYWHNELYKKSNYHYIKTESCEKNNVQLIQIYEDDWVYKKEIVKSRILNLLGKSKKIHARKCELKLISDNKLLRTFLNENHIQGFIGSKIKLGLYYNEELVSVMTFGNLRKVLGQNSKKDSYELLRFSNKLYTNVVGGASKLFKYFINNYSPDTIISYADRSWSTGKVYTMLGFTFQHKTKPNYHYIINNIRKHRFSYRKDTHKDISEKSEHQIMIDKKFYRIYDSGSLKFIYNVKTIVGKEFLNIN